MSKLTPENVAAVAGRCAQTYHAITALHDLCDQSISGPTDDPVTVFVVLREVLRSVARDMETCAEALGEEPSGFFAGHYGGI